MKYNYEERIVVFIDILGFSNIIKTSMTNQEDLDNLIDSLKYITDFFKAKKSRIYQPSDFSIITI
jgi:hypothetical protein